MKATFFTSLMAITLTYAKPVARQNQVCNAAPAGTGSNNGPISQPSAATATLCQQQCNANTQCQSFTFGLPNGATTPQCSLFAVAAGQVPAQSDPNITVFDKACSGVPPTAPTSVSTENSNSPNPASGQGNNNAETQGNNGNRNTQPRSVSRNADPPPPPQGNNGNATPPPPPQGNNGNVNPPPPQNDNGNGNPQPRSVNGNVTPPPAPQDGTTQPPPPQDGTTPPPPRPQGQNRKRANICGAAPDGPAGNSPTPIQTVTTIQTQDECLALCKQTSGCQS